MDIDPDAYPDEHGGTNPQLIFGVVLILVLCLILLISPPQIPAREHFAIFFFTMILMTRILAWIIPYLV